LELTFVDRCRNTSKEGASRGGCKCWTEMLNSTVQWDPDILLCNVMYLNKQAHCSNSSDTRGNTGYVWQQIPPFFELIFYLFFLKKVNLLPNNFFFTILSQKIQIFFHLRVMLYVFIVFPLSSKLMYFLKSSLNKKPIVI